jgi:hypothetical protein
VAEHDGEVCGIAVVYRRYLDRWGAYTLLLDAAAAEPLARIVDRSRAGEIGGVESDVTPLKPHLTRARDLTVLDWIVNAKYDVLPEFEEVDPRSRLATRSDVPQLAELYAGWPFIDAPTMFQLRRMLRRSIDAGLPQMIVEVDGCIVAALRIESRGCRYARWTDLVVHPDHRGRGYYLALVGLMAVAFRDLGVGVVGEAAPAMNIDRASAGLTSPEFSGRASEGYAILRLKHSRRFPGEGRLYKALYRFGGRRADRLRAEP